jgi:hypothetical protein
MSIPGNEVEKACHGKGKHRATCVALTHSRTSACFRVQADNVIGGRIGLRHTDMAVIVDA